MKLGTIPNNKETITKLLKAYETLIKHFDTDYIVKTKKKHRIETLVLTEIETGSLKKTQEFIREHLATNKLLWSITQICIRDDHITFWEGQEEAKHVADGIEELYMTPIIMIDEPIPKYWYICIRSALGKDKHVEYEVANITLEIRGYNTKKATVRFTASGKNIRKYYRLARKILQNLF